MRIIRPPVSFDLRTLKLNGCPAKPKPKGPIMMNMSADFTWAMLHNVCNDPRDGSTDTPLDERVLSEPDNSNADNSLEEMVEDAKREGIGGC
jgi:hypothetical protein